MNVKGPNDFVLICDKDGDPVDVVSGEFSVDNIFVLLRCEDKSSPADSPHSAWEWNGSSFSLVVDSTTGGHLCSPEEA
jgi:hypothetical protein